jgi:hypothetical protein
VHYDSEAQRRPLLQSLVKEGSLPVSYATDDHVAVVYENENPFEVVADTADTKARAYRLEKVGEEVVETTLELGRI